ncbi:hypothetical protein LTR62_007382 [Meristemomyces frigidus]|uniref:Heterokaryon incompatibility domain-containing protein n=1 Tax=Meristemomyces frigidus TaxID=1508187 RepID=A0AAN7THH7_9PEZI|nr:hypothetical protein LTR62_007382 [Meristemomyces frigidus]
MASSTAFWEPEDTSDRNNNSRKHSIFKVSTNAIDFDDETEFLLQPAAPYIEQIHDYVRLCGARPGNLSTRNLHGPSGVYTAPQKNEIRVFRLSPGAFQEALSGHLEHVNIAFSLAPTDKDKTERPRPRTTFALDLIHRKRVAYTAVSYTWGAPVFDHCVLINGFPVKVTATVDNLLRHIRLTGSSAALWIDQICIDQSSIADKEGQVALMGSIYRKAQNTLIWLGTECGGEAFDVLKGLYEATYGSEDLLDNDIQRLRHAPNPNHRITALEKLLGNPWFQRTWIIQEVVLSLDVYVMSGHDTTTFDDFGKYCAGIAPVAGGLVRPFPGQLQQKTGVDVMIELSIVRSIYSTLNHGQDLFDWLVATRYAAASWPIDKAYALLGLCKADQAILPDYSRSWHDVYCEIAKTKMLEAIDVLKDQSCKQDIVRHSHFLVSRILSCIDHDPISSSLPSWVPDWSQPRRTSALGLSTFSRSLYDAARSTKEQVFSLDERNMQLHLYGTIAGEIENLSPIFTDAKLSLGRLPHSNSSLLEAIKFAKRREDVQETANGFTTFCSTLVVGTDGDSRGMGGRSPAEYVEILSLLCDETSRQSPSISGQTYSRRQLLPAGHPGRFSLAHLERRKTGRTFKNLQVAYRNALLNRRLCWLSKDTLGLVPSYAEVGDVVCVIPGCHIPFVFRRFGEEKYLLIGEAYVHAYMDCEIADCSGELTDMTIV